MGCGVCDESEPEIRDSINEHVKLGVWSWILAIVFLVSNKVAIIVLMVGVVVIATVIVITLVMLKKK